MVRCEYKGGLGVRFRAAGKEGKGKGGHTSDRRSVRRRTGKGGATPLSSPLGKKAAERASEREEERKGDFRADVLCWAHPVMG
jgi:hypothetical protein